MSVLAKIFGAVLPKSAAQVKAEAYRRAIQEEAKVGGKLFGPVPEGRNREFFCLDERTWVWHEEWTDDNGEQRSVTTRYDLTPKGIFKAQDGRPYTKITPDEAERLELAAKQYNQAIDAELAPILNRYR